MDEPVMSYDPSTEVVTIDGFRFSREFLRTMTASPPGIRYRVLSRDDGAITVGMDRSSLEAAAPAMLEALQLAVLFIDRVKYPNTIENIQAAIKAATGG
jgi:hypothetical protein